MYNKEKNWNDEHVRWKTGAPPRTTINESMIIA
jgi:hypothetical protein